MKYILTVVALFVCFGLTAPTLQAWGQDQLPPSTWQAEGPQSHAERVLGKMVQGDNNGAFKLLFSTGRYPKQTLEKLQFDYLQTVKTEGLPLAYEKVFEQRAGSSVIRLKYVLLFKSKPQMFDLYYYNTGKQWALKTFTISRDIKKIFER